MFKVEGARGNGGYKKVTFKIEMCDATGSKYKDVKTYIANKDYINRTLRPYTWYKQHVLVGAPLKLKCVMLQAANTKTLKRT